MSPRNLSKSKLIAFRQCPKRLWLEIHKPDLREDSAGAEARMEAGNELGRLARQLYDPDNRGETIDAQVIGFGKALERSKEVLGEAKPLFEAGYAAAGGIAFADVMLPVEGTDPPKWRMIEVKSSTSVKDYHREDAAIQAYIARAAGVPLDAISVAHIDSDFVYPGGGRYDGLIVEEDLSEETAGLAGEVETWITEAQQIAALPAEPAQRTGGQCSSPFRCGYYDYCISKEPQAEMPVGWLPRVQKKELKEMIETKAVTDIREVPDDLLNEMQLKVKQATVSGKTFFDKATAARELDPKNLPAYFLDFETVQFTIPVWQGTRPYQQLPFQFSLHRLAADGRLSHNEFLDLTGKDPAQEFAVALLETCGGSGPIYVYNRQFEAGRISDLGERFPGMKRALEAITGRMVDVLPVARRTYYHPGQRGSWSIKAVLPSMVPELDYDALDGVKDGQMAAAAYLEAIRPETTPERREQIRQELLQYCWLDTFALVRVWGYLSGYGEVKVG